MYTSTEDYYLNFWINLKERYQEHHGIVGNVMYDPNTNKTFTMANKDPFWWVYNNSLPIWISALKANIRAGVYFWPGSEVRSSFAVLFP